MPVPISEEERRSPLYKYFERKIEPVPEGIREQILSCSFPEDGGLHPSEMDRLFDDGYLPGEFGIYPLRDGGLMIANHVSMPGVTAEMFDWWFAWHGLNSLRYKIWDPDEHYYVQTQNVSQALDESLSMKERYWNTTHVIKESLLPDQPPVDVRLTFLPPEKVGFSPDKLRKFRGTIVCTGGMSIMVHFLRPTPEGAELRTRFWIGYKAADGKTEKLPGFTADPRMGTAFLLHNVKEFTHLSKILPEVYAEFKDSFTVPPFHNPDA